MDTGRVLACQCGPFPTSKNIRVGSLRCAARKAEESLLCALEEARPDRLIVFDYELGGVREPKKGEHRMHGLVRCLTLLGVLLVAGCGTSQTSSLPTTHGATVKTIAMMPGGGLLADAVAVELSARGFRIVDSAATSSLIVRLKLNEVEIAQAAGLSKFKSQGVDAVLVVRSVGGQDQQPQSASARMSSTETGALIAGVTWQNGFGGQAGSIADRVMRKGLAQAATEIASELAARVSPA